jgi:hypothetical protein
MAVPQDQQERMILQSALYEYISHRQQPDVQGYVDKRYPLAEGYTEQFRKDKVASVRKNIELAEAMRKRSFTE